MLGQRPLNMRTANWLETRERLQVSKDLFLNYHFQRYYHY